MPPKPFCLLFCTSFNNKPGGKLELRAEWIEECQKDTDLERLCELWSIDMHFQYPSNKSIMPGLIGKMAIEQEVTIHATIVRF